MSKKERTARNLELVGGRPCLDFANTVSTRIEALRREYLTDYGQLVAWSQHAGVLTDDEAKTLLRNAARRPHNASATLDYALGLRETIYRVFSAIADRREPERPDLDALNAALRDALTHLEIVPSGDRFEWTWLSSKDDFNRMLWPLVRSAADLLTSGDLSQVRECAREGCDWLFVDLSKNHSRRWCSMNMCGSRVKARRYYRRRKRGKGEREPNKMNGPA